MLLHVLLGLLHVLLGLLHVLQGLLHVLLGLLHSNSNVPRNIAKMLMFIAVVAVLGSFVEGKI